MYKRDYLHKKVQESDSGELHREYKRTRNKVVKEIRQTKKNHYAQEISASSNPKQVWKTIRGLLKPNKMNDSIPIDSASFNKFFASIGPKLNQTFPDGIQLNWPDDCIYQFAFTDISADGVHKYLLSLPCNSNIDILGFDSKLLRCAADVLCPSLTELFNKSIQTHCLPADWKRARVTPIYKGAGSKDDPSNYRPISVVSHIPKALEKCINSQLMSYFEEHAFFTHDQSAFRSWHSTVTSVHKLLDDLMDNINNGLINGLCFFDLKKCFDTIDHQLLLYKLGKYGVRDSELLWFENYLSNRTQAVSVNGSLSDYENVSTGVPQGSVLGPLLFLIFINDLPKCLKYTASNIFADDTTIYACGGSLSEVRELLQLDTHNLAQWFFINKLIVSETKCYSMLATCNRMLREEAINVTINNINVNQVNSGRYLGIYPDSMLNWSDHIEQLCKKLAPKVGILRRLKHVLSRECLVMIYQSTIQSVIDYCITAWGYAPSTYLDRVQSLQNRAARIITGIYEEMCEV